MTALAYSTELPGRPYLRVAVSCGIYCRISDTDDEWGVNDQEAHCRALAEQMGWSVYRVYTDNDISASRFSRKPRPSYNRLVADLAAGRITAVVVTETNRLHRRPLEWWSFKEVRQDTQIKTLTDFINLRTDEGVLAADLKATIDEQESKNVSSRVRRKELANAREGKPKMGGPRTYGFRSDFTVIEAEAKVINDVADRIIGGDSFRAVARDLNNAKVPTVAGKDWSAANLKRLLASPNLAGFRRHPDIGEVAWPEPYEGILERSVWDQVQRAMAAPRGRTTISVRKSLLAGFLVCGICGHRLSASSSGGRSKRLLYVCKDIASGRTGGCFKISVTAPRVDETVVESLLYRLESHDFAQAVEAQLDTEGREAALFAEVARLKTKLTDATDDYSADLIDRPQFIAITTRTRARITEAEAELASLTRGTALAAIGDEDIRATWDAGSLDWRRSLISDVIESIVVLPHTTGTKGHRFNPARINIQWRV